MSERCKNISSDLVGEPGDQCVLNAGHELHQYVFGPTFFSQSQVNAIVAAKLREAADSVRKRAAQWAKYPDANATDSSTDIHAELENEALTILALIDKSSEPAPFDAQADLDLAIAEARLGEAHDTRNAFHKGDAIGREYRICVYLDRLVSDCEKQVASLRARQQVTK